MEKTNHISEENLYGWINHKENHMEDQNVTASAAEV